jgi:hypothetical protein
MESTDPEGLVASQLALALDIVLRFNNKMGGAAHGVKVGGGGMVGATHSAHGLMPHGVSRPMTGLASSAPQSYNMPQPQALAQQVHTNAPSAHALRPFLFAILLFSYF